MSVTFTTITGPFKVELHIVDARQSKHVENFLVHCAKGSYNNNRLLRYIPGFILQTGDPTNTGKNSPAADSNHVYGKVHKYQQQPEIKRGSVMCVNSTTEADGLGSQFFVVLGGAHKQMLAEGDYTLVGEIIDGIESIERIEQDEELADPAKAKKSGKVRGKWKSEAWITDVHIHHNPFAQ